MKAKGHSLACSRQRETCFAIVHTSCGFLTGHANTPHIMAKAVLYIKQCNDTVVAQFIGSAPKGVYAAVPINLSLQILLHDGHTKFGVTELGLTMFAVTKLESPTLPAPDVSLGDCMQAGIHVCWPVSAACAQIRGDTLAPLQHSQALWDLLPAPRSCTQVLLRHGQLVGQLPHTVGQRLHGRQWVCRTGGSRVGVSL